MIDICKSGLRVTVYSRRNENLLSLPSDFKMQGTAQQKQRLNTLSINEVFAQQV